MYQINDAFLDQVAKSIANGELTGAQTIGQDTTNDALKMTSLKSELVDLTAKLQTIKFYNMVPKPTPAVRQNIHQAIIHTANGGDYAVGGGFHGNTEIPVADDPNVTREAFIARNMHRTYSAERYAQMTDTYHGSALDRAGKAALKQLLFQKASNIYWSAESMSQGRAASGLYAQHRNSRIYQGIEDYYQKAVIDLRGQTFTPEVVNDAALRISEVGNVVPTHFFGPSSVANEFNKDQFAKARNVVLPGSSANPLAFQTGNVAHSLPVSTMAGNISIESERYASRPPARVTTVGSAQGAPNAPTAVAVTAVPGDALSRYQAGEAGSVFYGVTAISADGKESVMTVLPDPATASTIAGGDSNDLAWSPDNSGIATAGFRVYRTKTGATASAGAKFYWIADVGAQEFTQGVESGTPNIFRDRGRVLPGTADAFMANMTDETMYIHEFVPITDIELPATLVIPHVLIGSETLCLVRGAGVVRFVNVGNGGAEFENPLGSD